MTDNMKPLARRAEDAGVSVRTLYNASHRGLLKITKLGSRSYVLDSNWSAFLEALPTFESARFISGAEKARLARENRHAA